MPFLLSFILFINGATWTVYAVLTADWFIGVSSPNSFCHCTQKKGGEGNFDCHCDEYIKSFYIL